MAKNAISTIVLDVDDNGREFEGTCNAADFQPGMFVEDTANDEEFALNAVANEAGSRKILTEKAAGLMGNNDVTYQHASGDRVFARQMQQGRKYAALVVGAVNYTKNMALTQNGAGVLKQAATGNAIVARVAEAQDLSALGAGVLTLVKVTAVVDETAP